MTSTDTNTATTAATETAAPARKKAGRPKVRQVVDNFTMYLTGDDRERLMKVKALYRAPTISHAIRLMVDDTLKAAEKMTVGGVAGFVGVRGE